MPPVTKVIRCTLPGWNGNNEIYDETLKPAKNSIDWPYMSFKSHMELPPPPKLVLSCIRKSKEETQEVFQRIVDGKFTVLTGEDQGEDRIGGFTVGDNLPYGDVWVVVHILSVVNPSINKPTVLFKFETKGPLEKLSEAEAERWVAYRASHIVVRFLATGLYFNISKQILMELARYYKESNDQKELYDSNALLARLELQSDSSSDEHKYTACKNTGEALEAMDDFLAAGKSYHQCSGKMNPVKKGKMEMLNNAGIAYKRGLSGPEAEDLYVQSLHEAWYRFYLERSPSDIWDTNAVSESRIFRFMINNYCQWKYLETGSEAYGLAKTQAVINFLPLVALLSVCGYDTSGENFDATSRHVVNRFGAKLVKLILKKAYKTRKGAVKALARSAEVGTLEHFSSTLQATVIPGSLEKLRIKDEHAQFFDLEIMQQRNKKLAAQEIEKSVQCMEVSCYNCRKVSNRRVIMRCPCHEAYYCNRACQNANWKVHKKTCSRAKTKKK